MSDRERLELGRYNLHYRYAGASGFWRGTGYYMALGMPAHAAFLFHQMELPLAPELDDPEVVERWSRLVVE